MFRHANWFAGFLMIQDDYKLLELMLRDVLAQPNIYRPSEYWSDYSTRVSLAIRKYGLKGFRSNPKIGKGFCDTVSDDPFALLDTTSIRHRLHKVMRENLFVKKYFVDPYKHVLKARTEERNFYRNLYAGIKLGSWYDDFKSSHQLPDTLLERPSDTFQIKDHTIGASYLNSFLRLSSYETHVDFNSLSTVLEIGGGFGANAHTLLTAFPNICNYIYVDIPPMLYVGTQYLKSIYNSEVIDYSALCGVEDLNIKTHSERKIYALCPWQLEMLSGSIDLFYNSASFQEMSVDIIENYAKLINKLSNKNTKMIVIGYECGEGEKAHQPEKVSELLESFWDVELKDVPNIHDFFHKEQFYLGARER